MRSRRRRPRGAPRKGLTAEMEKAIADAVVDFAPNDQGWIRINCPLCELRLGKPDHRQSFGFSAVTARFECYRCGAAGRLARPLDEFAEFHERELEAKTPVALKPPSGFYRFDASSLGSMALAPALEYMVERRGIDLDLCEEAGIGACVSGWWQGRIIIPVIGPDSPDWLWYVGRQWFDGGDKPYLYPKGGRTGVLYNHAALLEDTEEPVLVVEGCLDALACWPDAVAVLGKPNPSQIDALVSCRRPVAVVLDGDAYDDGWALAMKLRLEGQRAGAVKLPPRVDPDEVDGEALWAAARLAIEHGEATL